MSLHAEQVHADDATPRSSSRLAEDPVAAAWRRAPRMSRAEAEQSRILRAEVKSDKSTWLTAEQFEAKIAARKQR